MLEGKIELTGGGADDEQSDECSESAAIPTMTKKVGMSMIHENEENLKGHSRSKDDEVASNEVLDDGTQELDSSLLRNNAIRVGSAKKKSTPRARKLDENSMFKPKKL